MKGKRTPGPWEAKWGYVGAKRRLFICVPTEDGFLPWTDADARHIVTACNNFDALVEALGSLVASIDNEPDILIDTDEANELLAKIKSEMEAELP